MERQTLAGGADLPGRRGRANQRRATDDLRSLPGMGSVTMSQEDLGGGTRMQSGGLLTSSTGHTIEAQNRTPALEQCRLDQQSRLQAPSIKTAEEAGLLAQVNV